MTTAIVVLAAVVIGVLLVLATGTDTKVGRVYIGPERQVREPIADSDSPSYIPHPGGGTGLWLDLERGELVAYIARRPGTDCTVRWRGSIDSYADCEGKRIARGALDRYELVFPERGELKDSVLVDFRRLVPATDA